MLGHAPNLPDASGWDPPPDHLPGQVIGGGSTAWPASGTIPTLDGFRAIAIIVVMLSHVGLERYAPGQFGVTLFFFLSGYLITTLLRRELDRHGRVSFAGFYLRRAVRIIPPMWLAIMLVVLFSLTGLNHPLGFKWLGFDFAFLSNYFPGSGVPIGLWSLSVEEHFYLLFPAVAIAIASRWGPRACAAACALVCVLELGVRIIEVARLDDFSEVNFWTHTRLDSILFGAILALWNNPVIDPEDRLPGRLTSYVIGGGLLVISFVVRDEVFRQTLRYTVQGVGLIFVFNAAIRDVRFAHPLLENAPFRLLAALSYMLYLVHGAFVQAAQPLASSIGTPAAMMVGLSLAFAFAYAARIWMEEPLAQWRRQVENRWRHSRSAPPLTSPAITHDEPSAR
jgi:peptidoglycan/LPS O-acetylase OafA/YrhL